jgi:hypothetical protein
MREYYARPQRTSAKASAEQSAKTIPALDEHSAPEIGRLVDVSERDCPCYTLKRNSITSPSIGW